MIAEAVATYEGREEQHPAAQDRRVVARATAAECGNAPVFQANLERVAEIERLFADSGFVGVEQRTLALPFSTTKT